MSAQDTEAYTPREKMIWLGGAVALLISVVVLGIVVGGGGSEENAPSGSATADGVLVGVADDRLTLRLTRPVDGQSEIEFEVRPENREGLDLEHLQLHASDGLPTRIYYEREGERYVARGAEDLPSPSR